MLVTNMNTKPAVTGELKFQKIEVKPQVRRTHAVRLHLQGLPPGLLMNPMSEETLHALALGQKVAAKPKDRNEDDICADKIYRTAEGVMCLPQTWLWGALSHAGRQIGYGDGKAKVSTADSTKLPEFLTFTALEYPFLNANKKGDVPWKPDIKRGVNTTTEGATGIIRPLIAPGWETVVEVEFHAGRMPLDTLMELFTKAGEIAGLGDYRPQKKGPFGTFQVIGIEMAELFEGADSLKVKAGAKKSAGKAKKKAAASDLNGSRADHGEEPALAGARN